MLFIKYLNMMSDNISRYISSQGSDYETLDAIMRINNDLFTMYKNTYNKTGGAPLTDAELQQLTSRANATMEQADTAFTEYDTKVKDKLGKLLESLRKCQAEGSKFSSVDQAECDNEIIVKINRAINEMILILEPTYNFQYDEDQVGNVEESRLTKIRDTVNDLANMLQLELPSSFRSSLGIREEGEEDTEPPLTNKTVPTLVQQGLDLPTQQNP